MKRYDAIVIGAGHNGIANAAFLAKAGLDVLLVEKNEWLGGAAVSRNLHGDWIYSNCSYVCSLLRPEVYRALDLGKYGLQVVPYGGSVTINQDGDYLGSYVDEDASRRELMRHSHRDADAANRYHRDIMRQCRFIRQFLLRTAPDPTSFKPRDLLELLHIGKEFWALGEETIYDTIRFYTMSIVDFLDEYFEHPLIRSAYASSGIIGSAMGVMSPGTAYVLLHHAMGDVDGTAGAWGFARGGMGAISNAMHACFEDHGGTTIAGNGAAQILVKDGKVHGVAPVSYTHLTLPTKIV